MEPAGQVQSGAQSCTWSAPGTAFAKFGRVQSKAIFHRKIRLQTRLDIAPEGH
jgi:multidrug efflux pump subunit AcrA (membrane-fusion protein)